MSGRKHGTSEGDRQKVMVTDITLPVEDAAEILRRRIADGARRLRGREDLQTPDETKDALFWILDATMQYMDLFDLEMPPDEPDAPGDEETATVGYEELMGHVGRSVLAIRRRRGMTQQALAERIGIAQVNISLLENGKSNPVVQTLVRIAEGLGCRLVIAFEDGEPKGEA